ncbi:MAG: hypothetical protein AAGA34_04385, partial [Pseudomonadota bacterium]
MKRAHGKQTYGLKPEQENTSHPDDPNRCALSFSCIGTLALHRVGKAMSLALSASFAFDLERPADALLQFEAAALQQQRVLDARTRILGSETINRVPAQDDIGERIWIHAQGRVRVRYEAVVDVERALTPL